MPSSTVENYLKAMHHLSGAGDEPIAIGRIAGELELTPGTVTTMMKHLGSRGLVDYLPRRGARLTPTGEAAALKVLRRHRLIELFLVEVMELDWGDVHDEAEELEHVISDRLLARMDEMLGHPTADPHGAPIPDADGRMPEQSCASLAEAEPGGYQVVQVSEEDGALLDWLSEHGLRPGSAFQLLSHDKPTGILRLKILGSGLETNLGSNAAGHLRVQPT
ncbi:metal-dependent transcriptional regulator [Haloferula sargassicola]|uniref:Transcriptional regulator MntR n=1 Tax=Haloferula sargassicola TaxID=490096 RepID=A0ABP9URA8_9BACT